MEFVLDANLHRGCSDEELKEKQEDKKTVFPGEFTSMVLDYSTDQSHHERLNH